MKLVSMVDYCLSVIQTPNINEFPCFEQEHERLCKIEHYARFLKQPLKLEMFVPCDDEGEPLEKPDFFSGEYDDNGYGDVDKYQYKLDLKEYKKAQEKVLFKGFELLKKPSRHSGLDTYVFNHNIKGKVPVSFLNSNIEDVIYLDLELTENVIKKLGLR